MAIDSQLHGSSLGVQAPIILSSQMRNPWSRGVGMVSELAQSHCTHTVSPRQGWGWNLGRWVQRFSPLHDAALLIPSRVLCVRE